MCFSVACEHKARSPQVCCVHEGSHAYDQTNSIEGSAETLEEWMFLATSGVFSYVRLFVSTGLIWIFSDL